jgi:hypothetical protein
MSKKYFTEEGHLYFDEEDLAKGQGKPPKKSKYISGTRFVHAFSGDFHRDYWLFYKGLKEINPGLAKMFMNAEDYTNIFRDKFLQINIEEGVLSFIDVSQVYKHMHILKNEWEVESKRSTDQGSAFHLKMEEEALAKGGSVCVFDDKFYEIPKSYYEARDKFNYTNESFVYNLSDLEPGYYPELIVWFDYNNHKFIGQADKVFITDRKSFFMDDYKTNKAIKTKGFYSKKNRSYQMMNGPCSHLQDCNLNHYKCQLNFYSFGLAQHGLTPEGLMISHHKKYDTENFTPYVFDIELELIQAMLDQYTTGLI